MDARSRAQRRSAATQRLYHPAGEVATSAIARARRVVAASLRGGLAALAGAVGRSASTASVAKLAVSLGELKGIPMKMGQLLSYIDSSLPDESRAELSALQTHAQPMSVARVAKILREELGAAANPLIDSLDARPIAAASIGQVHRGRLPDGTDVAVKVQYPGIVTAIENDFGPASLVARMVSMVAPALGADRFIREARARILEECDYRAEARHQTELAARLADHPVIAIPAVHAAYSTRRVLTTDFIDGLHLDDFLATDPSQDERDRYGHALLDFYVGTLLQWRVLPGDPHPGNYRFCADGRLAILDHGCTRSFDATEDRLVRVTLALEAESRGGVYDAIAELGGEALLVLRIRYGLASVLARLGMRAGWRALMVEHGVPVGDPSAAFAWTRVAAPGVPVVSAWSAGSAPVATPLPAEERVETISAVGSSAQIDVEPPPPPPPTLEVVLVHGGLRLIEIVREIRDLFSLGISEAKQIVDHAPRVVARTTDRGEAETLKQRLESSGGTVEIRSASDRLVN